MDEQDSSQQRSNDDPRYERFVTLLLANESRVRSFLRGLLPTWEDVDEVMQESSLVAWRKFDDFAPGTAFGAWMLTIARFEALKHRRRAARSPILFADDVWDLLMKEAIEEEAEAIPQSHLEACLQKLGPERRELLLKVHAPGVVMRELASQFGKNEQAFYKTVQRLRAIVLDCVRKAMLSEGA